MSDDVIVDTPVESHVDAPQHSEVEAEARKFGWRPQEEFKGDPADWRDADEFLKRGREINGYLRKDLDKINKRNEDLMRELSEMKGTVQEFKKFHEETEKRAYERALQQLREEKKNAIREGDGDRVIEIEEQMDALKEDQSKRQAAPQQQQQPRVPDPVFENWVNEGNQWYTTDREMQEFADATAITMHQRGSKLTGVEFMEAVKEKVKRAFPEKFQNENRTRPNAVEGNSSARPTRGGKSYSDLPPEAKAACDKFVKQGLITQKQYVSEYFSE